MKKILLSLAMLGSTLAYAQQCAFDKIHRDLMARDPEYKRRVEQMNKRWEMEQLLGQTAMTTATAYGTEYEIPLVVHVIHTGGSVGSTYNPSDASIQATIDYVNQAFAATYTGYADTNNGGVRFPIKFVLAKRDPSCASTTGINRVDGSGLTNYTSNGVNLSNTTGVSETTVKALSRWDNRTYYNIWVVNKIDGNDGTSGTFTAGYAYFPGASYTIDGTIMLATQMSAGSVTLPHELGHAFGLYHTFEGDGTGSTCPTNSNCATDGDKICDTEPHVRNLGYCASGTTNSCVSATYSDAAAKNIMNYTTCPNRFTSGQRTRFLSIMASSRPGLMSSMATLAPGNSVISASCSTSTTNALSSTNMGPILVKLNDLQSGTSGAFTDNANYLDYTCRLRGNLIQGQTYTLDIWTYLNAQNKAVWIDYNNDGAFTSGEQIASLGYNTQPYGTSADTAKHSISFTVPSTGVTTCTPLRMRVMSDFAGSPALPTTGCGTLGYGQTEDYTIVVKPATANITATITGTNPVCSGGGRGVYVVTPSTTLTSPTYQWYKNSQAVGTNSATYSATGLSAGNIIQCKVSYSSVCSGYTDSLFSSAIALSSTTDTNTWTGQTDGTWATSTNWSCGSAPTTLTSAYFPKAAYVNAVGTIASGTYNAKNLWIDDNQTLTLASGATINVKQTLTLDTVTISGSGKISLSGTTAQTIIGKGTISNLELNNSAGATIDANTPISITGTYTPTSGTLTTNSRLTLKSDATGTARIATGATGGGYISGSVTTERYIPGGRRAFRFFGHPFTTAMAMSQLTDDIDITGSGGSPFTTTTSNNPSAFYYDVTTGDNTTTGNNPGWTAFTASSNWNQYQAMRVLVRGAKGEGLTGGTYTPSAATISMSGTINQGNQTISLTKGSSTSFVLVGNPFPSQVNMDAVSGTNIGSSFYIWNANQGTRGGYTSYNFGSSSFNLPSGASFVTTLSANGSISIEEADKTSGTAGTMFKTTGIAGTVQLRLEDSTTFWDRLLLTYDDNAMATTDYSDAAELYNPEVTFYAMSKDDSMLSIDRRPYVENEIIPLGLYTTVQKNFKIVVSDLNMPAGTSLYLKDKYLSTTQKLSAGMEYWFTVTTDTATWGNNRFELNGVGKPTNTIGNMATSLKVKLVPNPTTENVTLYYEGAGKELNIIITNVMGVKVAVAKAENANGNIVLPTAQLASGVYNVTIYNGSEVMTQKLIKQ